MSQREVDFFQRWIERNVLYFERYSLFMYPFIQLYSHLYSLLFKSYFSYKVRVTVFK